MVARKSQKSSPKTKRPRIAPGVRAEVERRLRTGASYREISLQLGVADGSVRAIKKKLGALAAPEADASLPPDAAAAVDGLALEGDLKSLVRSMISKALAVAKMAEEDRNSSAAAKALRDAIGALPGLIRLEKAEAENVDAVSIPREVIDRELEAIYVRARTLASVEMCPHCGRELRMAAVGAAREKAE